MIIRRSVVPVLLTGVTVAALAGCSGSSSGGSPKATAPAGENTAKAVKDQSFHHLSAKANKYLGNLALMRGVQSEIYYPDTKTLTVTYRSTADKTDQANVEDIVRQARNKATAKPTITSKPKKS
ncbi:MAG TPA: hypothetical protein VHB18_11095 [Mycobacteriales bacterium]|jgi:hypothetical protein|nr:hypothetical protein [Mycobacteriales bacterium]